MTIFSVYFIFLRPLSIAPNNEEESLTFSTYPELRNQRTENKWLKQFGDAITEHTLLEALSNAGLVAQCIAEYRAKGYRSSSVAGPSK